MSAQRPLRRRTQRPKRLEDYDLTSGGSRRLPADGGQRTVVQGDSRRGGAPAAPTGDAAETTVPALDGGDGDYYQRVAMDSEDPHGADNGRTRRRRRRRGRTVPSLEVTAPGAADEIGGWTPDAIRDAQLRDPDIGPALWWTETGTRPEWTEIEATSPMLRALWQQYASLCVMNGVLYRSFYDNKGQITFYQLVLPQVMKVSFLEIIHNDTAAHLKLAKCIPHVMRRAWWLHWKRDLKLFIKCCPRCEAFHRGKPPKQAHMRSLIVGAPGERFAIDLCGPYPSSDGYKFLFTALCTFSKFGICVPLRNKEATTVAKALVDHVFLKYGLCTEILSDLGGEFQNEVMTELLRILGVSRLRTSAYRPQSNGQVEVWHRTLNSMVAKLVGEGQKNWSTLIPFITFSYNATEHSSTGFVPFFLFHGRMPLWTIDLVLPEAGEVKYTVPEYTATVVDRLNKASALVRENLRAAAQTASNWYNRNAKPKSFNVGDSVRVYIPRKQTGKTPKWQSFFRTEGRIEGKINDATYIVSSPKWRDNRIIHVDKIKLITIFPNSECNSVCVSCCQIGHATGPDDRVPAALQSVLGH